MELQSQNIEYGNERGKLRDWKTKSFNGTQEVI